MTLKTVSVVAIALSLLVYIRCGNGINTDQSGVQKPASAMTLSKTELQQVSLETCHVCHNPSAPSHDAIIAPPLAVVKMRYQRMFPSQEAFEAHMTAFVMNPDTDKAIMYGAVKKFGLMPATGLDEQTIRKIVSYIYQTELEEPVWLKEEMRKQGMD